MTSHATLSPSGAHRWAVCPASVTLEQKYPDTDSKDSQYGTAAHWCAEQCLTTGKHAHQFEFFAAPNGVKVDEEMVEGVQKYIDYVRDVSKGHQLLVEQRLDISNWVPECFGTSDAIVLRSDELVVIDLKFGMGVRVDAQDNPQAILYALGALDAYNGLAGDFDYVRIVIHQPRLHHISEWRVSVEELLEHGKKLREAGDRAVMYIDVANTPLRPEDFAPGEKQCKFCKAKADCPALNDFVNAAISEEPATGENLGAKMDKIALVEIWCKGVRAEVERKLFAAEPVEGWKLVEGKRGSRKWADEVAAEEMMKLMRLKSDEMYNKKIKTPPGIEKVLKDFPRKWGKIVPLIIQDDGKPSVAPISDKRPEFVVTPSTEGLEVISDDDLSDIA